MSFQVNGTTVIDGSRNFSSSAFPKTVNGFSIVGSGDMKYFRPTTYGGIGTYTVQYPPASTGSNNFNAGTTTAGSNLMVRYSSAGRYENFDSVEGHPTSDLTSYSRAGTWRSVSWQAYDTTSGRHMNVWWARIS